MEFTLIGAIEISDKRVASETEQLSFLFKQRLRTGGKSISLLGVENRKTHTFSFESEVFSECKRNIILSSSLCVLIYIDKSILWYLLKLIPCHYPCC